MRPVLHPRSVREAVEILARGVENNTPWTPIACTPDTLAWMEDANLGPERILNLSQIAGLSTIRESEGALHLGSLVSFRQSAQSPLVRQYLKPLCHASRWLGSTREPPLQGVWVSPILDGAPSTVGLSLLGICDAEFTLVSTQGLRSVPWDVFYQPNTQGHVMAWEDELLTQVSFTKPLWSRALFTANMRLPDRPTWSLAISRLPDLPNQAGGVRVASTGLTENPVERLEVLETLLYRLGLRGALDTWDRVTKDTQDALDALLEASPIKPAQVLKALRVLMTRARASGIVMEPGEAVTENCD